MAAPGVGLLLSRGMVASTTVQNRARYLWKSRGWEGAERASLFQLFQPASLTPFDTRVSIAFCYCRASRMESVRSPANSTVRKTPLHALHRRLGAKMVHFDGWDMPVEYPSTGGLVAEHKAVRGSVGLFDVSHMGDIRIRSAGTPGAALAAVQHITMNDASRLAIGQAQYSAMLYPQGTFVDDVIVHRLGQDDFLLVINAGTREKDFDWARPNTKT